MEKERKLFIDFENDIIVYITRWYEFFHIKAYKARLAGNNFKSSQLMKLFTNIQKAILAELANLNNNDYSHFNNYGYHPIDINEPAMVMPQNINSLNSISNEGKDIIRNHFDACMQNACVSENFSCRKIYLWSKLIAVFEGWSNLKRHEYDFHLKNIDDIAGLRFEDQNNFLDYLNRIICNIENKGDTVNKLINYILTNKLG